MAVNPNKRACSHIKVNGIRCGSPSLRGEVFCYFHQRMIRGVRTPPKSRLHPMAMLEDQESIQAALMEIVNALVRNQIDVPRARLVLRALSIAARHANRVRFGLSKSEMVKEIPEYPAAPPSGPFGIATQQAAALTTVGIPQKEESENERLSNSERERYEEKILQEERNRKPPASIRRSRPRRATTRARSG